MNRNLTQIFHFWGFVENRKFPILITHQYVASEMFDVRDLSAPSFNSNEIVV